MLNLHIWENILDLPADELIIYFCVNSLSSSPAGYYFCLIDRPLTDANYKSLFCLLSTQKRKLFVLDGFSVEECFKVKKCYSMSRQSVLQVFTRYIQSLKKYCLFSLAATKVAKNITPTTRNFLSFIALAFIHCKGVNIVIKTLTFLARNYTLHLQGLSATNL